MQSDKNKDRKNKEISKGRQRKIKNWKKGKKEKYMSMMEKDQWSQI